MRGLAIALCLCALLTAVPRARAAQPIITVMDFSGSGVSQGELSLFSDYITSHIVETGQYVVVDRLQRQTLLSELEFSLSDCTDERCQLEAGRLLAAGSIVVGSLGRFGDRFLLNVKQIEVETGQTLGAVSRTYESLDTLLEDSRALTYRLLGVEPPVAAPQLPSTGTIPERTMRVDGDFSDWSGLSPAFVDRTGDSAEQYAGTDLERIYMAKDARYLYAWFALAGLPAAPRGYMQAVIAIGLMTGDYLLLAVFYQAGWKAAVQSWNPRTGKSAPLASGNVARTADGIEARFPLAALRKLIQEGGGYATSAKTGVGGKDAYRDLDTVGPRFITY